MPVITLQNPAETHLAAESERAADPRTFHSGIRDDQGS